MTPRRVRAWYPQVAEDAAAVAVGADSLSASFDGSRFFDDSGVYAFDASRVFDDSGVSAFDGSRSFDDSGVSAFDASRFGFDGSGLGDSGAVVFGLGFSKCGARFVCE